MLITADKWIVVLCVYMPFCIHAARCTDVDKNHLFTNLDKTYLKAFFLHKIIVVLVSKNVNYKVNSLKSKYDRYLHISKASKKLLKLLINRKFCIKSLLCLVKQLHWKLFFKRIQSRIWYLKRWLQNSWTFFYYNRILY